MIKYYCYANGRPLRADINGATYNYRYNWHGDVSALVDVNGNGDGWNNVSPFGDNGNGAYPANPNLEQYYGWGGAWGYLYFYGVLGGTNTVRSVDLYYIHGRWWHPDMGIFLSPNEKGDYLFGGDLQDPANLAKGYLAQAPSSTSGCTNPSLLNIVISGLRALQWKCAIEKEAANYGLPWQVLGGVLESELEFDTGIQDPLQDTLFRLVPEIANYPIPIIVGTNPGPGIGNIHILTAKTASEYLKVYGVCGGCEPLSLEIYPNESNSSAATKLLDDSFSIHAMAAIVRMLADYRFGNNGYPSLWNKSNLADWEIKDAVAVWHGYRYGVRTVSPGGVGFTLEDFQDRNYSLDQLISVARVGPISARRSVPIFQRYFQMSE